MSEQAKRYEISDGVTTTYVLASDYDALSALVDELRHDFVNIVVGGCTCGTKPPDPALHELNCHYRMAETGLARIEKHRATDHAALAAELIDALKEFEGCEYAMRNKRAYGKLCAALAKAGV